MYIHYLDNQESDAYLYLVGSWDSRARVFQMVRKKMQDCCQ